MHQVHDLFQAPNVVGDPGFHCRGDAQGLMNPAKVVVHEMDCGMVLWFSRFFEKAFVSLVKRRLPMRTVRFCRSMWLVETNRLTGLPLIQVFLAPMQGGGE